MRIYFKMTINYLAIGMIGIGLIIMMVILIHTKLKKNQPKSDNPPISRTNQ